MTLEELKKEYERLGKEIEKLNSNINDEIFLLSIEEYENYKHKIPTINIGGGCAHLIIIKIGLLK